MTRRPGAPGEPSPHDPALEKAAHRAAAEAGRALAALAGGRDPIIVPHARRVRRAELPARLAPPRAPRVVMSLAYAGTARGAVSLVLSPGSARRLLARLLPGRRIRLRALTPMQRSALSETANVVVSAWLAAMSAFLGARLLPSPADLAIGPMSELCGPLPDGPHALVAEMRVGHVSGWRASRDPEPAREIRGMLVAMPAPE